MPDSPAPVVSGALHYFRVHPEQWEHRVAMCAALGLTAVETYVPWNLHEPRAGDIRFDGRADIARFLDIVADAGLDAIVRPGPYICAEWDNGGIPSWASADPSIALRSSDPRWLALVDGWFDVLIPVLAAKQATRGGPVVMMQVENEYGSFGSDAAYLAHLRDGLRARGVDVPLFTSDGPTDVMLTGGSVPGVPVTVNFGSEPEAAFAAQRAFRPDDPLFCMEFWGGWFDHWGTEHVERDAGEVAGLVDRILSAGASINLYMAHGGTNFGTGAGANRSGPRHDGAYEPTTTSYDYDAPIDERGAATDTFWRVREVVAAHRGVEPPLPPDPAPAARAGAVVYTGIRSWADIEGDLVDHGRHAVPPTFERIGVDHGLVRYRTRIAGPRAEAPLLISAVGDRAHVRVDGSLVAVIGEGDHEIPLAVPGEGVDLELVVESMGRVNYGPLIGEHKGIRGEVRHERQIVHGWDVSSAPIDVVPGWAGEGDRGEPVAGMPVLARAVVDVEAPGDAVLDVRALSKGYVWINGELLGRYWGIGPTTGLHVPAPLLRTGGNELVVLDVDGVLGPLSLRDPADTVFLGKRA